jgi:hypothetical protein
MGTVSAPYTSSIALPMLHVCQETLRVAQQYSVELTRHLAVQELRCMVFSHSAMLYLQLIPYLAVSCPIESMIMRLRGDRANKRKPIHALFNAKSRVV